MEQPSIYEIASYVDALKIFLRDSQIQSKAVAKIVEDLPTSSKITRYMSDEEALVVYESVRWAWQEITGKDISESLTIDPSPQELNGNYWILTNGVLLHGVNHYVMIKRNINIFSNLLEINPFLIHQKMAGPPEQLIKLVIDHGGIRFFVAKDRTAYFQMNDKIYTEWGREKVKKLDFKTKIVKLIDSATKFSGWKSGITLKL